MRHARAFGHIPMSKYIPAPPQLRTCSECNKEKSIRSFPRDYAAKEKPVCLLCNAGTQDAKRDFFTKNRHGPMNELDPYRRLSAAVILSALHCIKKGTSSWKEESQKIKERSDVEDAKWFLQTDMHPYSTLLDLDVEDNPHWRKALEVMDLSPNKYRFADGREESTEAG